METRSKQDAGKMWQEAWVHQSIHSNRKGHEVVEPYVELSLDVDVARVRRKAMHGGLLDSVKHFDLYVPEVVRAMLLAAGCDANFVALMSDMWLTQSVITKLAGHYGLPDTPSNGIGQGCTISLLITNLDATVWLNVVQSRVPGLVGGGFVDDRSLRHEDDRLVAIAMQITSDYDEATGHELNLPKSLCFF